MLYSMSHLYYYLELAIMTISRFRGTIKSFQHILGWAETKRIDLRLTFCKNTARRRDRHFSRIQDTSINMSISLLMYFCYISLGFLVGEVG